jgi:hypothetical protein
VVPKPTSLAGVTQLALKALQRPEVREAITQNGAKLVSKAQAWQSDRSLAEAAGASVRRVTGAFGQAALERRVARLHDTAALLRSAEGSAPEVTAAAAQLEEALGRIDLALKTAANLPLVKRKRAHWQIDHLLDELEGAAFSATLSSAAKPPLPEP